MIYAVDRLKLNEFYYHSDYGLSQYRGLGAISWSGDEIHLFIALNDESDYNDYWIDEQEIENKIRPASEYEINKYLAKQL